MGLAPDKRSADRCITLLMTNLPTMLRDHLSSVFADVPDIRPIEPANLHESTNTPDDYTVDVALVGSSMTGDTASAVGILESLLGRYGNAKAIVLTQKPNYTETVALFRAGARGIICSVDLRFDELCKSIRCVHEGQVWARNELVGHLLVALSRPKSRDVTDAFGRRLLTKREQQVLHLLADGLSNQELAAELKVSEHTIKNHLFRVYDKLGVSNRMEAALYALTPRPTPAMPIPTQASPGPREVRNGKAS